MKKLSIAGLATTVISASMLLAACGDTTVDTQGAADAATAAGEEVTADVVVEDAATGVGDAGFEEIEIWADEEVGFLNVNGVFFQPVPMSGGNENYEDFDLHFEADVSALPNNLGYGPGDWVPYMKVEYELTGDNGDVIKGTFMPMNADDGNHYGANLKMPNAGTYSVKLTFHSPEESGFLIHLDDETGPGGSFDDIEWPLVLELPDVWDYVPVEW